MFRKIPFFPFFFFVLFILGCTTSKNISQQNLAHLYKKEPQTLSPSYIIYHINDSLSQIRFKVNSKTLLYSKQENQEHLTAQVRVFYKLLRNYESDIILDSSSIILTDNASKYGEKDLIGEMDFKASAGNDFVMEVMMIDMNRRRSDRSFIKIGKKSSNNRENFFLTQPSNNAIPIFKNNLKKNEIVNITYNKPNTNKLFVRFYNRDFPIAAPPFVIINNKPFNYDADSLFEINLDDNSTTLGLSREGFYHIQYDTAINKEGLTLFLFESNFPGLQSAEELIPPLRYITNKQEYDDMIFASNKKEALDNFWLKNAGDPDRAKELIKRYYNRVKEANSFFSSYIEGWKTDRGMIYIIFGAPNVIYKTSNSESWVYGEDRNLMSLNLTFYNVINPFTDNDFILDRSVIYKNNWYRAVDTWRQGRIF